MANEYAETNPESSLPENVVLIGKKPPMNYVLAVVTQFNNGVRSVKIRARGNSISRAVDVAEIARNRFVTDIRDPSRGAIAINSEELANEDGTRSKVSSLQIVLTKPGRAADHAEIKPENVVLIGKKPPMNYVLAVVTQFNNGVGAVAIKARGNAISRAVDVAEIARNRFVTDITNPSSESITIGSEEISNEDGTKSKVSSIEITLTK